MKCWHYNDETESWSEARDLTLVSDKTFAFYMAIFMLELTHSESMVGAIKDNDECIWIIDDYGGTLSAVPVTIEMHPVWGTGERREIIKKLYTAEGWELP